MNNIIDPTNGKQISLFSSQGKALLKQYIKYYQSFKNSQSGGSEEKKQVGGDYDPEFSKDFLRILDHFNLEDNRPEWIKEDSENMELWIELMKVANKIWNLSKDFRLILIDLLKNLPEWMDENSKNVKLLSELVEVAHRIWQLSDEKYVKENNMQGRLKVKLAALRSVIHNQIEAKQVWKNEYNMDELREIKEKYVKYIMDKIEGKTVNA